MKLTEKQKILKRLRAFCKMLGDGSITIDAALHSRIETTIQQLSTPTKVVLAGLSGARQYQLSEFFLGTALFDDSTQAKAYPPVRVRHGLQERTHSFYGNEQKAFDGIDLSLAMTGKCPDSIDLEMPNPIVSEIGFSILPAYDSGEDRSGYLITLLNDTEVIIWCSDAVTPWQPAERRLWFTVPDSLKQRSILALTGAEKLREPEAQNHFEEKCALVSDEFRYLSTISVDLAKAAAPGGAIVDAQSFASSGGQALLKQLMAMVQASQADVLASARQLRSELDKIPLGSVQPVPEQPAVAAAPSPKSVASELSAPTPAARLRTFIQGGIKTCQTSLTASNGTDFTTLFEDVNDLIAGLIALSKDGVKLAQDHDLVIAQLREASELVGLLSYENTDRAALEAVEIAAQVTADCWHRIQANDADTQNLTEYTEWSAAG